YYTTLAAALYVRQDEEGGWWVIMDAPDVGAEWHHIERSASAMFKCGLLEGISDGHIADEEYYARARSGY
ncbi:glycoside hydrolase family 105 protein, partial [Dothistroma septosporum NZE10]